MNSLRPVMLDIVFAAIAATGRGRFAQRRESNAPTAAPAGKSDQTPGDYVESIVVAGMTRQYRLHIPPSYQPGKAMPLVVNIHGFNSFGQQQENLSKMSIKANQAGFIAARQK